MATGWSELRFAERGGRTALVASRTELPLVVQRPLRGPAGQALVVMLTPAGALFDDDALHLNVTCGPHTDVTLTTAAATKLNRCDRSDIAFQLDVRVCHGAAFRYLPHELIPFRGTSYRQRIHVALESDAQAWLLEVIGPGATDEPFTYTRLQLETEIRGGETLLARERIVITPENAAAQLRGLSHYGSLQLLGPGYDRAAAAAINDRLAQPLWPGLAGASELPANGIGLKMLGDAAQSVRETLLASAGCPGWLSSVIDADASTERATRST